MIKRSLIVLVALAFAFLSLSLTSCAKKQIKKEEPVVKAPEPAKKAAPAPKMGDDEEYKRKEAERQRKLKELARQARLKGEIEVFQSQHIYFDFDKYALKPAARATLAKKAAWLRANPEFKVRIEGHCDERGSNEYNLTLGEKRALEAWKYLNALGISGSRLITISWGEERPADPGHSEAAWAKNRRDEFKVMN